YENSARETFSVTRLSFLLSSFALEGEDGIWTELENQYAWIDAEKRRTLLQLEGIPAGQYRGIRFYIGPDAAANKSDPAKFPAEHPLNPNLNGLHWSWQGGYIFMALEGMFRGQNRELQGYS